MVKYRAALVAHAPIGMRIGAIFGMRYFGARMRRSRILGLYDQVYHYLHTRSIYTVYTNNRSNSYCCSCNLRLRYLYLRYLRCLLPRRRCFYRGSRPHLRPRCLYFLN